MNDHDTPWKRAVETFFPDFLQACWPRAHVLTDWTVKPLFLEQELPHLSRCSRTGKRWADKVALVATRNAGMMVLHIEIQHHYDRLFPARMLTYHRRLCERHYYPVHSIAILADDSRVWRPTTITLPMLGGEHCFRFPIFKVLDCLGGLERMLSAGNPFEFFVAADLLARKTRQLPQRCLESKLIVAEALYAHRQWSELTIGNLLSLVDWLLELPRELQQTFESRIRLIERRYDMELMPRYAYRAMQEGRRIGFTYGREEGRVEGRIEGRMEGRTEGRMQGRVEGRVEGRMEGVLLGQRKLLGDALLSRFGRLTEEASQQLNAATEQQMNTWVLALCHARSLEEVFV